MDKMIKMDKMISLFLPVRAFISIENGHDKPAFAR